MYDVNCKYKIRVLDRCKDNEYSPLEDRFKQRLKDPDFVRFLVNVWHGYSHKPECSDEHSIRNCANTGMVTGEEIESGWSILNMLQYWIQEMNAGGRADAITWHMFAINLAKINSMGKTSQKQWNLIISPINSKTIVCTRTLKSPKKDSKHLIKIWLKLKTVFKISSQECSMSLKYDSNTQVEISSAQIQRPSNVSDFKCKCKNNRTIISYSYFFQSDPTVSTQMEAIGREDALNPGKNLLEAAKLAERGINLTLYVVTAL